MKMSTTEIDSMVQEVADDFAADIAEADNLLREIVNADRRPTIAEQTYFRRRLSWDDKQINDQYRRMASVVRLQAIAGTPSDRQAASAEATTAAKILQTEGPKILDKITKLQQQHDALERDARLSAKRVSEQAEAVVHLRDHLPISIAKEADSLHGSIYQSLAHPVMALQQRQEWITKVLAGRFDDKRSHMSLANKLHPGATERREEKQYITTDWSADWPRIKKELAAELEGLPAKIAEAQSALDAEMVKVDTLRDYYSR